MKLRLQEFIFISLCDRSSLLHLIKRCNQKLTKESYETNIWDGRAPSCKPIAQSTESYKEKVKKGKSISIIKVIKTNAAWTHSGGLLAMDDISLIFRSVIKNFRWLHKI